MCQKKCWKYKMERVSHGVTFHYGFLFHISSILLRVKEQRNILHEISKWKANWVGHILGRNCLLQRVIEGKIQGWIEVTGRRGRRRTKLLDDLKERRGYPHLKEEALDRTVWRDRFGRGFGPVVRQTTKWMRCHIHPRPASQLTDSLSEQPLNRFRLKLVLEIRYTKS